MHIDECFRKKLIRKIRINDELVKSLVEMSEVKEQTVKTAKIDSYNISAYVSMAYDSLREILEAISISKGYKVLSHLCLGELLKKILEGFDYGEFDRFRYIRNGINYYGVKIEFKQGNDIINSIFRMKKILIKKYMKN